MRWKRRKSRLQKAPTAFISEGSALEGKCSFKGTVMLNGQVKGDIHATAALIVGGAALIQAQILAPVVVVYGEVVGAVAATERIELRGRARVVGDLETPLLVIEEGAAFEGRTKPLDAPELWDPSIVSSEL